MSDKRCVACAFVMPGEAEWCPSCGVWWSEADAPQMFGSVVGEPSLAAEADYERIEEVPLALERVEIASRWTPPLNDAEDWT